MSTPAPPGWQGVLATVREAVAADEWIDDATELAFLAQDVYGQGQALAAALRPARPETLCAVVPRLAAGGIALLPRGGGLSYTDGYLAMRQPSVLLDLSRLDRVVEINATDRYVRVQAGCTWEALDRALEPHGLRTPYWGPLSGLGATVGGALSQGSTFLGSGQHGAIGDSVLGIDVLTASGQRLRTGAWADDHRPPFFRYAGPDLSGLFIGDCGALGIKLEASLRLLPRPPVVDGMSFQFVEAGNQIEAMSRIARSGLASECFGFDPLLARMRLRRASLMSDARTLGQVVRRQGLLGGLRLARAGRDFLDPAKFSLHLAVEGAERREVAATITRLRSMLKRLGEEVENSIPRVLRSQPFAPPTSMLGPAGERWVPVHGIVPHSRALASFAALQALFEAQREVLEAHCIVVGYLLTTVAAQGFLIEPVFYWPDSHTDYLHRVVPADFRARCGEPAANPSARAAVATLRRAAADCLHAHGACHFQLGKFYHYRRGGDPAALALFDAIKAALDPQGVMNPGVLR